ncbi:AAA family ATPase [Paenibacillus eucommiae]|uniref:Adenylate kinase family enzyme n=1 Tax=Paenibacillus eucommiae TaxID=1355755 RepID=A0ABS4J3J1_9BACL|nr:AAA family ATPase [Paenibacillus eucommiae]MBP1994383.1 adenylate kinase family enzyme [Paenibacillus eucommiae]
MASGKTTLAKRLENKLKAVTFSFENPIPMIEKRKKLNLDMNKEKDFIINQRMFIETEIERFQSLPEGKVIFDRGPEDIEFFTLYFPLSIGQNWDVKGQLKKELQELGDCRSDFIVYLDASENTLLNRKQNDHSRKRGSFEKFIQMYPYEKEWYNQFNTTFIDVDHKTPEELEDWTLNYLHGIGFI